MTATPIFDQLQQGLARKNDRITSVVAAEAVTEALPTRDVVLDILRTHGPLPHEWICRAHGHRYRRGEVPRPLSPQRIRTVTAQLVDEGLVEPTGEYIKLPGARCSSTIWRAVP